MNHVIDSIDSALWDWETSEDAMRWAPDAPQVAPIRVPQVRMVTPPNIRPLIEAMEKAAQEIARVFNTKLVPLVRAIERMDERAAGRRHQPIALRIDGHEYHRRSRKRRR